MSFTASINIGVAPLAVEFEDTTAGNIISWQWNFGDGSTSEEKNPSHIYNYEGMYDVVLVVTYEDLSQDTFEEGGFIVVDKAKTNPEDVCLRMSTEKSEGYGWSKIEGIDWVYPFEINGCFQIVGLNNVQRNLIIDKNDFTIYEIGTCDRIINTDPSVLDKEGEKNTEVAWEKWEKSSILGVAQEHESIKHENSYIYINPVNSNKKGALGYTEGGQRESQQLSLSAYIDNNQVSPSAVAKKFPENGTVVFTGKRINNNRVQMVYSGTAGEIRVTGHVHEFISDKTKSTAKKTMNEHIIQKELSTGKVLYITRGNPILNRVTGLELDTESFEKINGPDSRSNSAVRFLNYEALNTYTEADYTIIIWSKTSTLFWELTGYSQYSDSVNGWSMYYKKGNGGLPDDLELVNGDYFDIRIYRKIVSDEAIEYLYNDIVNNNGKMLLPGF